MFGFISVNECVRNALWVFKLCEGGQINRKFVDHTMITYPFSSTHIYIGAEPEREGKKEREISETGVRSSYKRNWCEKIAYQCRLSAFYDLNR